MKRSIVAFLIVFLTTSGFFPWSKDKYSKIADKAFQEIKQNETSDDAPSSQKESGHSSTVKKVLFVAGTAALLIGGGVLVDELSKDKYEKVAEKALEAVKDTK